MRSTKEIHPNEKKLKTELNTKNFRSVEFHSVFANFKVKFTWEYQIQWFFWGGISFDLRRLNSIQMIDFELN